MNCKQRNGWFFKMMFAVRTLPVADPHELTEASEAFLAVFSGERACFSEILAVRGVL